MHLKYKGTMNIFQYNISLCITTQYHIANFDSTLYHDTEQC